MGFLNMKPRSPAKGKGVDAPQRAAKRVLGVADASEIQRHRDLRDEISGGIEAEGLVKDMPKPRKRGER